MNIKCEYLLKDERRNIVESKFCKGIIIFFSNKNIEIANGRKEVKTVAIIIDQQTKELKEVEIEFIKISCSGE